MKRIATYCFYDPKGEVAQHKIYYLSQLVKFVDRLIIVCNGELNVEGRSMLEQFTDDVIVRENEGFDFWAHKTGLEYSGWDELAKYDNYLLCNDTCYGPIFPFEEMFGEMDKRECDFWGMVALPGDKKVTSFEGIPFPRGYLKEFIGSMFINFNSRLLKSYEFKRFWDTLKNMSKNSEAVVYGEYSITHCFHTSGFKYDVWVNTEVFKGKAVGTTRHFPYQLLKDHRTPLVRKKAFNSKLSSDRWHYSYGDEAYKAMEYIEQQTEYDSNMIWDDILCNNHLSDIQEHLQLEYIISENHLEQEYIYDKKIAVICHISSANLVDEFARYFENFPSGTDFYLTTTSEEALTEINKEYSKLTFNYTAQIISNQVSNISALLVTYAHIVTSDDYEYICYFHDKKTA